MKPYKKYISAALFGIFFFPLVFQSAHILLHHPGKHSVDQPAFYSTCCSGDRTCGNDSIATIILIASDQEKACPVCEYQFTKTLITVPLLKLSKKLPILCYYPTFLKSGVKQSLANKKSPRAPPYRA